LRFLCFVRNQLGIKRAAVTVVRSHAFFSNSSACSSTISRVTRAFSMLALP
jgi:hypothetical protein